MFSWRFGLQIHDCWVNRLRQLILSTIHWRKTTPIFNLFKKAAGRMDPYQFKQGDFDVLEAVRVLLKNSKLPFEDIGAHYSHFITVEADKKVLGVVGLENCSGIGLLRSLAVDTGHRDKGLGKILVNRMIEYSCSLNISVLCLLTTTADGFFKRLGFEAIERDALPAEIKTTAEFKSICPVSAICMKMRIRGDDGRD